MKTVCCGFSIILIIMAMLNSMGIVDVNESNVEDYVASDCVAVADFIENNFETFVDEYNLFADDTWSAKYVEKRFPITIDECGNVYDGVFLDFDNENGYAVVGNDYVLLDFVTLGDSPYMEIESETYYYSCVAGYYYLSGNEYISVEADNNVDENYFYKHNNTKHYNGQESDAKGCGKIKNPTEYVKDKYGNGWKIDREKV